MIRTLKLIVALLVLCACTTEGVVLPIGQDTKTPEVSKGDAQPPMDVTDSGQVPDTRNDIIPDLRQPDQGVEPDVPGDTGNLADTPPDLTGDDVQPADGTPEAVDSGPLPCETEAECDDDDDCTFDSCKEGSCTYQPMPPGICCDADGDCDDGVDCTEDSCKAGKCFNILESNLCCTMNSQCDDYLDCTLDFCVGSTCAHLFLADDQTCQCFSVLDCNDGLICTKDSCMNGQCIWQPSGTGSGCCQTNSQCDDGNPSTVDKCEQLTCSNKSPKPCLANFHCDDEDPCTTDTCIESLCQHGAVDGCCQLDGQCADDTALTTDQCVAGLCVHFFGAEPKLCTDTSECDDDNDCTVETCTGGMCSYTKGESPQCCFAASTCDDGDKCTDDKCANLHCESSPAQGPIQQAGWDFDAAGLTNWDIQGDGSKVKWQMSSKKYMSGPNALYFGDPAGPTINNGKTVSGSAYSPPTLFPPKGPITLKFWTYIHVEPLYSKDLVWITVKTSDAESQIWSKEDIGGTTGMSWKEVEVPIANISSLAGKPVQIGFHFDSEDNVSNDYEGVYVDSVELLWPCQ